MNSRSKYLLTDAQIKTLFQDAGFERVTSIVPMGAGEFNSVYCAATERGDCVLKVAPKGSEHILTYEKNMMVQEVFFYREMEKADIRVPKIYYSDFSCKKLPCGYFIMERLEGETLDKANLTAAEKREAKIKSAEMLAKLHMVRHDRFGYPQAGLSENWYLALTAMIGCLISDLQKKGKQHSRATRLLQAAKDHRAVLEQVDCRLVNFDFWAPNIIVRKSGTALSLAWIDPERCFYGDRIGDFMCLDMMKLSLDGKADAFRAYNAATDSPLVIDDALRIRFALMLGYAGLIMDTEKYYRYTPLHLGFWRNVFASRWYYYGCFHALKKVKRRRKA